MRNEFLSIKPCKGTGTYAVIPSRKMELDMEEVKGRLRGRVLADTPYMVVIKVRGVEVSIYRSGKMLVRGVKKIEQVNSIIKKVYGRGT